MPGLTYILFLAVYILLLVLAGRYRYSRSLTYSEYYFADRRLGLFLTSFTITASWIGAASTIVTANAAYKTGFASLWLMAAPTFLTLCVFLLLNRRIRKIRFETLPLLFLTSYGRIFSRLSAGFIFFYMIMLAASQIVAWGTFIAGVTGVSYGPAILTGMAAVLFYSYFSGFFSVVLTDMIQFIFILAALFTVFFFVKNSGNFVSPADFASIRSPWENIKITCSFTLAWVISPIVWQRIASARSRRIARNGLLTALFITTFFYLFLVLIAIMSRPLVAGRNVFAELATSHVPLWVSALLITGIGAAIMSTADTAVNIASLTLARDIRSPESQKFRIGHARLATILSGILALIIAWRFRSILFTLGLASEIMAEGLFIPGMFALLTGRYSPRAGLFSLIAGGGFAIASFLNAFGLPLNLPKWPHSMPWGLSLALIGFAAGYLADRKAAEKNQSGSTQPAR